MKMVKVLNRTSGSLPNGIEEPLSMFQTLAAQDKGEID
jgi:hypothetical protein